MTLTGKAEVFGGKAVLVLFLNFIEGRDSGHIWGTVLACGWGTEKKQRNITSYISQYLIYEAEPPRPTSNYLA